MTNRIQERIDQARTASENNSVDLRAQNLGDLLREYRKPLAFVCGIAGFAGLAIWIANVVQ